MFPSVQAAINEFDALDIMQSWQAWRSQPAPGAGRAAAGATGAPGTSAEGGGRERSRSEAARHHRHRRRLADVRALALGSSARVGRAGSGTCRASALLVLSATVAHGWSNQPTRARGEDDELRSLAVPRLQFLTLAVPPLRVESSILQSCNKFSHFRQKPTWTLYGSANWAPPERALATCTWHAPRLSSWRRPPLHQRGRLM
jgi:hypothetical protein